MAETVLSDTFAALYARWHLQILRYVLTLIPDRHQAEDVVQETARVLWQKFAEYDPDRPFWPWARQIAYFEVLKSRKKRSIKRKYFSDEMVELLAEERDEQEDMLEERRQALQTCLASLSEEQRQLLMDRYSQVKSIEELAQQQGKTANALYLTLHRIRQILIQCVRKRLHLEGWT